MDQIHEAYNAVLAGDAAIVQASVEAALRENLPAEKILNAGLIGAMTEVGTRFENGEMYVPEMLIAARAMQSGLVLLRPRLAESGVKATGKVVIGTVRGDLHTIGKNLVAMMLEGAGFEVIDLGNDVPPESFAAAARQHDTDIVAMSALLTTTMPNMRATIEALEDIGIRGQVKVMIGGAPVTEEFARQIGADSFGPDAATAVRLAKALVAK